MLQIAVWWVRLLTAQKPINSQVGGKEGEVAQSCPALCDPLDCSTPDLPVHHQLMSIESVMPSNHLILCCPFLLLPSIFPSSRSFPLSQFFTSGGQSIGVSASTSVLPMNTQDWSPFGWTGWISLQSKEPSRVFSSITVQKYHWHALLLTYTFLSALFCRMG